MTPEQLDAIRKRCEAATPGPWEHEGDFDVRRADGTMILTAVYGDGKFEDATFCAHAKEDIPALLAEVERLRNAATAALNLLERENNETRGLSPLAHEARDELRALFRRPAP